MSVETFRTTTPQFYLSPSREEMKEVAKKVGLKSYAHDFVADLANLAAGGEVTPPSSYRETVRAKAEATLPKPDGDGDWRLANGNYTRVRQEAVADRTAKLMRYHESVQDFLRTVDLLQFGGSPLEQAMGLLKVLAAKKGGEPGEGGETLPIFSEQDGQKTAKDLNEAMESVESMEDAEKEIMEREHGETEAGEDADLQKRELAADLFGSDREIWLKVSRRLENMAKMKVSRSSTVRPDPAGDEVRTRPMKGLDELPRVVKTAWALRQTQPTYFWYKAVSGGLQVRERVMREDKKQLLYVLIDASGSMDNGQRIAKAGGVVMNRLKAVVEGEAEVFVRFFDSRLYEEHHASTAAEAKEVMRRFEKNNFSGGSTNITGCAKEALKRIEELVETQHLARPELVVITDGDDSVSLTTQDLGAMRLHAFVVGGENAALTDLAVKSGGVGIKL